MGYPTLTYTLTNGTTADATQVMQDFNDILNGITDGTKDVSINALTAAGTATLNGNVIAGSASSDDLTINASLASSIPIKTNNTYDIGGATAAPASIYLGAPSSRSTRITANQSLGASNTLVLPNGNGNAGQKAQTDGSGNLSWAWQGSYVSKNDNYTVLDTDGYSLIDVSVVNKTITLPTAADNTGRIITVRKAVSGAGTVTVKGEAAGETVDGISGSTGYVMDFNNESITLQCTGSVWIALSKHIPIDEVALTVTGTNWTTGTATGHAYKTNDSTSVWRFRFNIAGSISVAASSLTLTVDGVTFKNGPNQAVAAVGAGADQFATGYTGSNNGTIRIVQAGNTTPYSASGDVILESKPTFVV